MRKKSEGIAGYTGPGGYNPKPPKLPNPDKKAEPMSTVITAGIVVVVMLFIFIQLSSPSGGNKVVGSERKEAARSQDTESMAYTMTQVFTERHLLAPASADWPWSEWRAQKQPDGSWVVLAQVDSQNAFGAQIRNQVNAVVEYTGGDDWKCRYLSIGGQVMIGQ